MYIEKIALTMFGLFILTIFVYCVAFSNQKQYQENAYKNICSPMKLVDIKKMYGTFIGCLKEDGTIKYIEVNE